MSRSSTDIPVCGLFFRELDVDEKIFAEIYAPQVYLYAVAYGGLYTRIKKKRSWRIMPVLTNQIVTV